MELRSMPDDGAMDAYAENGLSQAFIACGDAICSSCAQKSGDDIHFRLLLQPREKIWCLDCGRMIQGEDV